MHLVGLVYALSGMKRAGLTEIAIIQSEMAGDDEREGLFSQVMG